MGKVDYNSREDNQVFDFFEYVMESQRTNREEAHHIASVMVFSKFSVNLDMSIQQNKELYYLRTVQYIYFD